MVGKFDIVEVKFDQVPDEKTVINFGVKLSS